MADLTIPDEAIDAVVRECNGLAYQDEEWAKQNARGALDTAAPLIVAAELERLAAEVEQQMLNERADSQDTDQAAAIRNVHTGAAAAYGLTMVVLRERVRELRGA